MLLAAGSVGFGSFVILLNKFNVISLAAGFKAGLGAS